MKHRHILSIAIPLALLLSTTDSLAAKLYKWVDADGNISYQDSPPPANAKLLEESTINVSSTQEVSNSGDTVTVYTVENCEACVQLVTRLRQLEVPFSEQSLMDRDVQQEIISESESLTAPTLKIGGDFHSGLSDDDLRIKLIEAGHVLRQEPDPDPVNRLVPDDFDDR